MSERRRPPSLYRATPEPPIVTAGHKLVTLRFAGDVSVRFTLTDEQAAQMPGIVGQAWNERTGVMYTFIDGGGTHLINLLFVEGVHIQ